MLLTSMRAKQQTCMKPNATKDKLKKLHLATTAQGWDPRPAQRRQAGEERGGASGPGSGGRREYGRGEELEERERGNAT
jgi:hypothetical protein